MYFLNQRRLWFSLKSASRWDFEWHSTKDSSLFVILMSQNSISWVAGSYIPVRGSCRCACWRRPWQARWARWLHLLQGGEVPIESRQWVSVSAHKDGVFSKSLTGGNSRLYGIGLYYYYYYYYYCRGANRRNRYTENPPNCMGGIREFNCACLIVSLVLALLPNTSYSFTLLRIIAWSLQWWPTRVLHKHAAYRKKPDEGEHETPRYHGV